MRPWLAVLAAIALIVALPAAAGATTVTRHQNPHYRVTASLTPTAATVGQRLTIAFAVTNTTDYAHRVSIQYEFDGPSFGQGTAMSPILLKPHTSWTTSFTHRATEAGGYKAIIKASDAAGTSHATATATAG
jgi:hypothetical protein